MLHVVANLIMQLICKYWQENVMESDQKDLQDVARNWISELLPDI